MERKTFSAMVTKSDEAQGIVEAVWAVMGNVDEGLDVIHPGAFTKTFAEHGRNVSVLDKHQTDSVLRVLGHPMAFRELGRDELPVEIKSSCPDATGGAWARIKFNMKTQNGSEVFHLLEAGDVREWSFGYDVLDCDFSKATKEEQEVTVRNLRTLKLWEISPVIWGRNSETATTGTKQKEQKPWDIFPESEQFCVYKVDEEGNQTGESLGCHDTEEEAQAQMAALYANEETDKQMTEEDNPEIVPEEEGGFSCECIECGYKMESSEHCRDVKCPECGGQMRRAERPGEGDKETDIDEIVLDEDEKSGRFILVIKDHLTDMEMTAEAHRFNEWLDGKERGFVANAKCQLIRLPDVNSYPDSKAGRVLAQRNADRLVTALGTILEILEDAGVEVPGWEKLPQSKPPPDKTAPDKQAASKESIAAQAGPDDSLPTSDELTLLDIHKIRLALTG